METPPSRFDRTRVLSMSSRRASQAQGAGFLGGGAAPPRVVSIIIIRTDAAAPMSSPPGNRAQCSWEDPKLHETMFAVGCRRLKAIRYEPKSGRRENDTFGKRWARLNVQCRLGAGRWLTWRQVAQAHGCLVACSGNVNRIGLRGARNEGWFYDSILKRGLCCGRRECRV